MSVDPADYNGTIRPKDIAKGYQYLLGPDQREPLNLETTTA